MQGWIKLHRELFEKAIWRKTTSKQKAILITILLMANHKPAKWIFNGELCECDAGQFITSLKSIQENCGKDVSIKNIRTALELFEKLEFLANKSTRAGRLITIVNYKTYQALNDENGKDEGNEPAKVGQRAGKEVATNNNVNNENNENNVNNNTVNFKVDTFAQQFELARVLYPGTKRGLSTEYSNFIKRYPDYKRLLPLIKPAIEKQIAWRNSQPQGKFIPEWKNFTTWINNRCWEEEMTIFTPQPQKSQAELAFENIIREREKNGQ